jgi:hypothetical protein
MQIPGIAPERKRAAMDTEPAVWAKMIMGMDGGMIGPMTAEARAMAVAVSFL